MRPTASRRQSHARGRFGPDGASDPTKRVPPFSIRIVFVLLPLAVSTLTAWAESPYRDLLSHAGKEVRSTYALDVGEALEDVATLERVMREGYSGHRTLAEEGFDWKTLFGDLRDRIDERESWRQTELLDLLVQTFSPVPDLHLGFVHRNRFHPVHRPMRVHFTGVRVRKEKGEPLRIVEAPRGKDDLLGSELIEMAGEASREFLFETIPAQAGAKDFLLGRWTSEESPDPVRILARSTEGAAVEWSQPLSPSRVRWTGGADRPFRLTYIPFPRIEVRTFSALAGPNLEPFLESAEKAAEADWAVVDLRGNGGGSDRYARVWLERLLGEPLRFWNVEELISPVTLQGEILLHRWLMGRTRSEAEREEVGGRLAYALEQIEQAESEARSAVWVAHPPLILNAAPPQKPFAGRLVLLVDSNTGSSAETFVMLAAQSARTIVVGENTKGMMRFGEIKLYPLPHSGIWLQAGSKRFEDPNDRFVEGRGLAPDYWIDDSASISEIVSALEAAGAAGWSDW